MDNLTTINKMLNGYYKITRFLYSIKINKYMKGKTDEQKMTKTGRTDDNVIYIGIKPSMNYVLASLTQLNSKCTEIQIKARGKSISKAVDVAQIIKNKFLTDLKTTNIEIGTDEVISQDGKKLNISTISLTVSK